MIDRNRIWRAGIWALSAPLPRDLRRRKRQQWRDNLDNARVLAADYVVLSRAKSGRTWLRVMLSRLYQQRFGLPDNVLLEYDNFRAHDPAAPVVAFTHGHGLDALARDARRGERLRRMPVVFLYRDPRDVAVSEYFQSMRRAASYKRSLYGVESAESMLEFLLHSPLGLPAICNHLNHWHRELASWPSVHRLRYEDLRADPEGQLAALCEFLGQPAEADSIADAVAFASFEALKRKERDDFFSNQRLRARDKDDPDSYKVRRGKVGGWRDYFAADEIVRIDEAVAQRLDPAIGYTGS